MSILQMSISIPTPSRHLSSVRVLAASDQINLLSRLSQLSIHSVAFPTTTTIIRMGGGPRTFPGGVSKWQWKRMQAKKAKQLLKARLCRERQIYEMRKRAELKASVSELERPWEVVERAPALFSVKADEQLKALADRFQRPGGYDLWSERDGPQIFQTADGPPSARFFPKGVVHSTRPYERITGLSASEDDKELSLPGSVVEAGTGESIVKGRNGSRRSRKSSNPRGRGRSDSEGEFGDGNLVSRRDNWVMESSSYSKNLRVQNGTEERVAANVEGSGNVVRSGDLYGGRTGQGSPRGRLRNKGNRQRVGSGDSYGFDSEQVTFNTEGKGQIPLVRRGRNDSNDRRYNTERVSWKPKLSHSGEVYDMRLKQDGSYEVQTNQQK